MSCIQVFAHISTKPDEWIHTFKVSTTTMGAVQTENVLGEWTKQLAVDKKAAWKTPPFLEWTPLPGALYVWNPKMDGKIHPKLQSETVLPRMVYLPCLTICHQRFSTYYDIFYILIYYVSSGTTVPPLCSLVWRKKCRKRGPFSGQPTSCTFPKTFQDSDVSAKKRYLLRSSWGSFPIQQDRGFGLDIKVLDVLQKPRLKTHYLTFNLLQSTGFRSPKHISFHL